MREVYADHAATTFPRHPQVPEAMSSFLLDIGCSPGRGGYRRSLDASRLVYDSRALMAEFFKVPQPEQVVFTPSVTYSLNLLIKGLLQQGDHVIISSMEHNSVVRPLTRLVRERAVTLDVVQCNTDGTLDPLQVKNAINNQTKLVVLTHASNVTGTFLPVHEVGEILKGKDIFYAIDVAQTAGSESLGFGAMNCDYLAFTGHKGLLGPPGIGGLCISERAAEATESLVEGGTGSRSEDENQPGFLPDKFESGTLNVPGIAGLAAGVKLVNELGLETLQKHKRELTAALLLGLAEMPEIEVYGTKNPHTTAATVSINVKGMDNGDLSFMLEQGFGIMTRSGLHCSPLAHRTIGTFPQGTLRFSLGWTNTSSDVEHILSALSEIIREN
ncbi:MAG: aminotransferase class V-fold PLP-dependent enzyme [Clostridiales bacterium]|jgi:cysteine desulfurase family protein|nr:aminotransferase class V-fold PLP-dependent enzyme [Clostridiales bacterium]